MKQWYETLFENYGEKYDNECFAQGTIGECDFIEKEINHNKTLLKPNLNFDTNNEARTINTITLKSETPQILAAVINDKTSHSNNFISSLWLTEDIINPIYNPNQYFQEKNNQEALDVLLISEEWKRYNWQDLMNNSKKIPKLAV